MSTYEDAISASAGWGLYDSALFIMCGFCFMAEGSLTAALSNVLPISAAEVNTDEKTLVSYLSTHTAGMVLGSVLGGVVVDATGRRCVVPLALMMAFTGTTIWAFAGNSEFIFAGMFILGMGLGMHSLALRVYLSEMLPPTSRGSRLALLSIFWAIGFFFASGLQLLLEPLAETDPLGFRPTSWRVVASFSACFTAIVACTCGALGPSTRWLLAQSRVPVAAEHVRRMYAINKSRHADTFQVPRLRGYITEFPASWRMREDNVVCTYMVMRFGRQVAACFKRPHTMITLVAAVVRLPVLNGMWTDIPWMAPHLIYPCSQDRATSMDSLHEVNGALKLKMEVYQNVMVLAAVVAIAATLLHFVIDSVGHRLTLFVFLGCALGSLVCVVLPVSFIPQEAICCILFGCLINAEITFTIISIEIYPTHIRGTANGLTPLLGRSGAIAVNVILQRGVCLPVVYTLIGTCALSMLLVWKLPEHAKRPMHEVPAPALVGRDSEETTNDAVPAGDARPGAGPPPSVARATLMREEEPFGRDPLTPDDPVQPINDPDNPPLLRRSSSAPPPPAREHTPRSYRLRRQTRRNQNASIPLGDYVGTKSNPHPEKKQEIQRGIKTMQIVTNSYDSSQPKQTVNLVIISDVPISSATVISSRPNVQRRDNSKEVQSNLILRHAVLVPGDIQREQNDQDKNSASGVEPGKATETYSVTCKATETRNMDTCTYISENWRFSKIGENESYKRDNSKPNSKETYCESYAPPSNSNSISQDHPPNTICNAKPMHFGDQSIKKEKRKDYSQRSPSSVPSSKHLTGSNAIEVICEAHTKYSEEGRNMDV